jgi:hypothetical protein
MTRFEITTDHEHEFPVIISGDGQTSFLSFDEAIELRESLGEAIDAVFVAREPKPAEATTTVEGVPVKFYLPADKRPGPFVYFGAEGRDGWRMNTAERRSEFAAWTVYNMEGRGRYGKKRYATAGAAVAHRMGISGMKGQRFALALNEALRAFMIEATDD